MVLDLQVFVNTVGSVAAVADRPYHERSASHDVASGEERWRWDGDGPAYGSPIVVEVEGVRQVIAFTQEHFVGVAADGGEAGPETVGEVTGDAEGIESRLGLMQNRTGRLRFAPRWLDK